MGDPNATDIPAAAAAERTSRFRATKVSRAQRRQNKSYTFISINVAE